MKKYIILISLLQIICSISALAQQNLKIGIYHNSPFAFFTSSGSISGDFIEIINTLATEEKVSVSYSEYDYSNCLIKLETKEIDLMLGYVDTLSKNEKFEIAGKNIFINNTIILSPKSSKLYSLRELNEKSVLLLKGEPSAVSMEIMLEKMNILPQYVEADNLSEFYSLIKSKNPDFIIVDMYTHFDRKNLENYTSVSTELTPIYISFAAANPKNRAIIKKLETILRKQNIPVTQKATFSHTTKEGKVYSKDTSKKFNPYFFLSIVFFMVIVFLLNRVSQKNKTFSNAAAENITEDNTDSPNISELITRITSTDKEEPVPSDTSIFSKYFDYIDEFILAIGNNGRLVFANKNFYEIYTDDSLSAKLDTQENFIYLTDLLLRETFSKTDREIEKQFSVPIVSKDGNTVDIIWKTHILKHNDELIMICNGKKLVESTLCNEKDNINSKIFLKATLDVIPYPIAILDDSGKIILVNKDWKTNDMNVLFKHMGVGVNFIERLQTNESFDSDSMEKVITGLTSLSKDNLRFSQEFIHEGICCKLNSLYFETDTKNKLVIFIDLELGVAEKPKNY